MSLKQLDRLVRDSINLEFPERVVDDQEGAVTR